MHVHVFVLLEGIWLRVMEYNATFNNISVISWRSVLLVEETGVPGKDNRLAVSHWQTLSHKIVSSTHRYDRHSNSQRYICIYCRVHDCKPDMDQWHSMTFNISRIFKTLSIIPLRYYYPIDLKNTVNKPKQHAIPQ